MKILFVCKSNMFRSRIAEAYFKKINKNKRIKADCAGLVKGDQVNKKVARIVKELGLNIDGKPKGLSWKLLRDNDIIVITADDVPRKIFNVRGYTEKIRVWKIKDIKKINRKQISRIVNEIKKKIRSLVKELEKWQ